MPTQRELIREGNIVTVYVILMVCLGISFIAGYAKGTCFFLGALAGALVMRHVAAPDR